MLKREMGFALVLKAILLASLVWLCFAHPLPKSARLEHIRDWFKEDIRL
jgi:hypothetical protein